MRFLQRLVPGTLALASIPLNLQDLYYSRSGNKAEAQRNICSYSLVSITFRMEERAKGQKITGNINTDSPVPEPLSVTRE